MQYKIFAILYSEKRQKFEDTEFQEFVARHEIVEICKDFFSTPQPCWTVFVCYREASHTALTSKTEKREIIIAQSDQALYEALRGWRNEAAKQEQRPPYVILTNEQLAQVATTKPTSLENLKNINGIGKAKLENYGKILLEIIAKFAKSKS